MAHRDLMAGSRNKGHEGSARLRNNPMNDDLSALVRESDRLETDLHAADEHEFAARVGQVRDDLRGHAEEDADS